MLFLSSLLIITIFYKTEGVRVTSVTSDPIRNGTSANLTFCVYNLSSGESINGISWRFAPIGGSSSARIALYDAIVGFSVENSHVDRLSRPDPNSGILQLNDTTTNDSGNYSCTVVTNAGQDSSSSIETVYVPPNEANLTLTQVNEYLSCKGLTNAGTPAVSLQIVRVATSTDLATQQNLTLTARWNALGNHICSAKLINFPNFTVPGIRDGSHVVRDYPRVMSQSPAVQTVKNGDSVTLEVIISGDPAPQPTWSRSGTNTTSTINTTHILATLQFNASIAQGEIQFINCSAVDDVGFGYVTFQITSQGCICHCPCKCTIVIALVVVLAIATAVLLGWTLYLCFEPGGICGPGKRMKLERWKKIPPIVLIVITAAFVIAVGAYSLNCYGQCNCAGCHESSCCTDAYCPEAYNASIAFVVLGSLVVIFAIVILVLRLCCLADIPTMESDVPLDYKSSKDSRRPPGDTRSGGNNRRQDPSPPADPQRNGNGRSHDERMLSPRQLPPLNLPENTDNDQPHSEKKKKKKKTKKDQLESEELRPLPALNQPAPPTERRPSTDAHVNMSGSNISPLPMRNAFTPGQPASGQSESAMTPIGSSSLKRN